MAKNESDKKKSKALEMVRYQYGEAFLEKSILCRGRPVIVKGKFNIHGLEDNKLIFTVIRPYIENVKTPKKIYGKLEFRIDELWKVRLAEKAGDKEAFYIIGYIKVIYENFRPKGTLVLAEDFPYCPIMTANQFMKSYLKFRELCYIWPAPGEISKHLKANME